MVGDARAWLSLAATLTTSLLAGASSTAASCVVSEVAQDVVCASAEFAGD